MNLILDPESRKLNIIQINSISVLCNLFFLNSGAITYYFFILNHEWSDWKRALESSMFIFLVFCIGATIQLTAGVRVRFTCLDPADNSIMHLVRGVLVAEQTMRPLSEVTAVVIRRHPTLFIGRVRMRAADFAVDLSGPGFLLPGQSAAAREIAEFLGVPVTDERGCSIPYRA